MRHVEFEIGDGGATSVKCMFRCNLRGKYLRAAYANAVKTVGVDYCDALSVQLSQVSNIDWGRLKAAGVKLPKNPTDLDKDTYLRGYLSFIRKGNAGFRWAFIDKDEEFIGGIGVL